MMKELLLMRHAKSSWDNAHLSDYQRPLNGRGTQDAPRMGRLLRQMDLLPDLIISSSAVRAATTAELMAEAVGYEGDIRTTDNLYLAEPETYLALWGKIDGRHKRVMTVGHNPGMEELVEMLSGRWERMPTGAIAHFQLSIENWNEIHPSVAAKLLNIWWPKEIKG
jgi:phosphohistidine phosphatase